MYSFLFEITLVSGEVCPKFLCQRREHGPHNYCWNTIWISPKKRPWSLLLTLDRIDIADWDFLAPLDVCLRFHGHHDSSVEVAAILTRRFAFFIIIAVFSWCYRSRFTSSNVKCPGKKKTTSTSMYLLKNTSPSQVPIAIWSNLKYFPVY